MCFENKHFHITHCASSTPGLGKVWVLLWSSRAVSASSRPRQRLQSSSQMLLGLQGRDLGHPKPFSEGCVLLWIRNVLWSLAANDLGTEKVSPVVSREELSLKPLSCWDQRILEPLRGLNHWP